MKTIEISDALYDKIMKGRGDDEPIEVVLWNLLRNLEFSTKASNEMMGMMLSAVLAETPDGAKKNLKMWREASDKQQADKKAGRDPFDTGS